jgi:hypothetical protein
MLEILSETKVSACMRACVRVCVCVCLCVSEFPAFPSQR